MTGQCGLDLQPHEVAGVVKPAPSVLAGGCEPPAADQSKQDVARTGRHRDRFAEVVARRYRVDVPEDLVSAVSAGERAGQPGGKVGSVFAAIAHEYPGRDIDGDQRPRCRGLPDPALPRHLAIGDHGG
jgi:hypothetical protein